jgi:dipeptidyl aminopeptidase/acylaminoacyl peptidase
MTAVESGGAAPEPMRASLQRIDVVAAQGEEITTLPVFPLDGVLQISMAPDGRSAALLASVGQIPPVDTRRFASPYRSWAVDKQLGFVEVAPASPVRWLHAMPEDGRYILDLLPWSSDGAAVAVRARPTVNTTAQALFVVSAHDLSVTRLSPEGVSVSLSTSEADVAANSTVLWTRAGSVLTRAVHSEPPPLGVPRSGPAPRADWWLLTADSSAVNLTAGMRSTPAKLMPVADGRYVGIADGELWSLDLSNGEINKLTSQPLPNGAEVIWPLAQRETPELLIAGREREGTRPLVHVTLKGEQASVRPLGLPSPTAQFEAYHAEQSFLLLRDHTTEGTYLWTMAMADGEGRRVLALNEHLAAVAPSEKRLIEYRGADGDTLKAGVILPPGYQSGRAYPVVAWVYAGSRVQDLSARSLDIYTPGQYNLHLYAARGYVVLIPSMPLRPRGAENDDFIDLPKGVMPALNRLIDLGIADPDRLAVMGQSYGGYSVYSLVTYTNRFKAAIAMAGLTNLVSLFGQFDPTARSYEGIDHHKSHNWGILESGQFGMGAPPSDNLWRYLRNSPLYFVDRVQTPLLLIHGEQDIRGPMTQAEEFFYGLYRQGKRARLLRYWGDDHGLRLSPANVRSMVEEIFRWLEAHMPEEPPAAAGSHDS